MPLHLLVWLSVTNILSYFNVSFQTDLRHQIHHFDEDGKPASAQSKKGKREKNRNDLIPRNY